MLMGDFNFDPNLFVKKVGPCPRTFFGCERIAKLPSHLKKYPLRLNMSIDCITSTAYGICMQVVDVRAGPSAAAILRSGLELDEASVRFCLDTLMPVLTQSVVLVVWVFFGCWLLFWLFLFFY